ncbi:hypothetical protein [Vibrio phage XZ1]|uniref:Uncharacterized protein n=1 Tax=Vibrio phage ValKK3 TaxID=1610855 RepID=A0A0D4DBI2_9CAUD|nr:hypothetical protein AVU32_gp092 [Vibrio phage ValKK3]AJT60933.1 hypothetical protein [Vibrio phage ValKK3]UOL51359.1 hypothetical protein [Vibrio phage XZ1]
MKELLKTMKETEEAIAAKFGLDHLWHGLVDCTDSVFAADEQDLLKAHEFQYGDCEKAITEGNCYGVEVYGTSVWLSDDKQYLLIVADDGSGGRDFYIFDMSKHSDCEMY